MSSAGGVKRAGALALGTLVLGLAGCGYKTPPVPPATVVPVAIEDLRASVEGDSARLTWTYPDQNIKGDDIGTVAGFDLYMAEVALADYCPSCPVPFAQPIEIDGGETVVQERRRVAIYDYDLLRQGHKYFFKVRSKRDWWAASGDSNIVTFTYHVPPAIPGGLNVHAADSSVLLSWQPVKSLSDGQPLTAGVVYQVLRQSGEGDYDRLGEPAAATTFTDQAVTNGQPYNYQVQAVLTFGDDLVYGAASAPISVTPIDTTPPPAPTGVLVVDTGQSMRVVWEASEAEDVAGYNVYRKSGSGTFTLIGSVVAPDTSFIDEGMTGGPAYAVTAFDSADPANESKRSQETRPRY